MRAMLESLIGVVPQGRAVRLREELDLLHRASDRAFPDAEDRTRAGRADSLRHGRGAVIASDRDALRGSASLRPVSVIFEHDE